jgi:glycosyltransferase involved in cell wall biosynthesis
MQEASRNFGRSYSKSSIKHEKLLPYKYSEAVCYGITLKEERKLNYPLKVFAIFFHPKTSVTAMGGAEKRFVETLKIFDKKHDLEVTVLEAAPDLLTEPKIKCKKDLVFLNFHGNGWLGTYLEWALWIVKAFFKGFRLLRHVKLDVIFIPNNTLPNLVLGYFFNLIFHAPLCIVVHHIDTTFSKPSLRNYSIYNSYREIKYSKLVSLPKTVAFYASLPLLKKAKAIISVSNFTAKALENNGVNGCKIFVSGNAVDLALIKKVKPYSYGKVFDGVFVGRIAKEKGIFDLLKVWKNVVKVRKNAKLLVIGNGLELPFVKEKISALGLEDKVSLYGQCNDTELYSLLKSSKLFIFPSVFEGWGMAVAEALACGLPVVAYDIPALREVFGECESVFLVPIKNIESMTSTVLDILNVNENEWVELSHCSKSYSKRFSWEKIAQKDLELLRDFKKRK